MANKGTRLLNKRTRDLMHRAHAISGRSTREVGAACYLDHSYVAYILKGKRRPRREKMLLLCVQGWGLDNGATNEILRHGGYQELWIQEDSDAGV
jgi:hypothetical protein